MSSTLATTWSRTPVTVFDGWEGIHDYGVNTSVINRIIDHLMSDDPAFADDAHDGRRAKIIVRYGNSVAVRQACRLEHPHVRTPPLRIPSP